MEEQHMGQNHECTMEVTTEGSVYTCTVPGCGMQGIINLGVWRYIKVGSDPRIGHTGMTFVGGGGPLKLKVTPKVDFTSEPVYDPNA